MKKYKIVIPYEIDGEKAIKEFRISANSVQEAYFKAKTYLKQIIEDL